MASRDGSSTQAAPSVCSASVRRRRCVKGCSRRSRGIGMSRDSMRARSAVVRAAAWSRSARPTPLLAVLVAAQFAVVAWLAFDTPHNGWIWYSGGDATEYWASQWSVAHGMIPPAFIGWGLPIFYAWIPLVAGVSLLQGLPFVVLLHVLVLGPLLLVLVWALADLLYGRVYAWCVAVLWVLAPVLAVWALAPRYSPRFEESVLAPHWAGLTDMADFPSLVLVVATAWATMRAIRNGRFGSAVGAGVLGGVMLGLKPSNGYFVLAVAVAMVVWKRRAVALGWAAGVAPGVLTLVIWKARGLGRIPILDAYAPHREAAGHPLLGVSTSRYVPLDWHHFTVEWSELREVFWDLRLLQFLLIASVLGALRRNPRAGAFLLTWFVAYCVLKGMSSQADISTTSYFRLTLPGLGALVFLLPAIGFLWPGTRRAVDEVAPESRALEMRSPLVVAAALAVLVPLAVVLLERPAPAQPLRLARYLPTGTEAPISTALRARLQHHGGRVRVSWSPVASSRSTHVFYGVIRSRGGDGCTKAVEGAGGCWLSTPITLWSFDESLTDRPGRGRFFYRVVAVADNRTNTQSLDLMLVGPPVS